MVKNIDCTYHTCACVFVGAWQAVRHVFPGVAMKGCIFHWSQAVWRKVQDLGLVTTYRERDSVYRYIRHLMALPFLPSNQITDTFASYRVRANSEPLRQLVSYFDNQWMNHATFDVPSWCVYGLTIRTNNDVEGK